jgi:holdfast attachment protein HfaA
MTRPLGFAAAISAAAAASGAAAQSLSTSAAQFNAGYGRVAGQENRPTSFSANTLSADMTTVWSQGPTTLVLTGAGASGVASGFASASLFGTGLSVVTQQGRTTTVVNLGASSSAAASAEAELNGTINLDGPH